MWAQLVNKGGEWERVGINGQHSLWIYRFKQSSK